MARLNNLYKWLVYVGLETRTLAGWSTRGSASFNPKISMTHWIAGRRGAAAGTRPGLTIVRDGHGNLPGPLCNVYLGRAGEAVTVASGRANHAGYGSHMGVTGNTGAAGIEAEAADNDDWTAAQKASYPLVHVAILLAMWERGTITWGQITADRVVGHSEYALPAGRKIDVNGYTMDQLRAQVAALIPGFKSRVNRKAISVGTDPVYDIAKGEFIDGQSVDVPSAPGGSSGGSSGGSGGSSGGSSGSGGSKSIAQMATEVIAGQHGQGHANRRRSLGISQSRYEQVRALVNQRASGSSSSSRPAQKSVSQMASEVINGRHGTGHANRRRSLGVSQSVYNQVRNEVNRRASGGGSSSGGKSISQMASEVIAGQHGNGHANRQRSLGVNNATYAQVRAAVNRRA